MIRNFLLFTSLLFSGGVSAQTLWTKYANNPVLTKGPSNWDIIGIGQPTCLIENDTIKMWYVGVGNDMKARICYAYSINGINWTKYNGGVPVLDVGASGNWDSGWLDAPEIVKGPSGYLLYYYGDTAQQSPNISSAYGVATSPDGINWTKYPSNPVFTKGSPGDWDEKWIESPAIVYDTAVSVFKMWYNGLNYSNWLVKVGYATSPNGYNWTKYAGNPVVNVGPGGSFDDMFIGTPAVLLKNNVYEMWYSGFSSISGYDTLRIGYATSSDGINWTKYSGNPLFSTVTPPYDSLVDDNGPWAPDVVFDADSNKYKMLWEAKGGFLFAESPNTTSAIENDFSLTGNEQSSIAIFPNPFSLQAILQSDKDLSNVTLSINDIYGQTVKEMKNINGHTFTLQRDNLPAGMYLLRLTQGNKIINTSKFVITE